MELLLPFFATSRDNSNLNVKQAIKTRLLDWQATMLNLRKNLTCPVAQ
jgi:hypothetical protein